MNFERLLAETMRDASEDFEVRLMRYSGRGMMGRNCVAVQGSMQAIDEFVGAVIKRIGDSMYECALDDDHCEEVASTMLDMFHRSVDTLFAYKQDALGTHFVRYWPEFEFFENRF